MELGLIKVVNWGYWEAYSSGNDSLENTSNSCGNKVSLPRETGKNYYYFDSEKSHLKSQGRVS